MAQKYKRSMFMLFLKMVPVRFFQAFQRGAVSEEQKELLLSTANGLYTEAMMSPEYSNEEFEAILQSKSLYKRCGIEIPRKGRPKKGADND